MHSKCQFKLSTTLSEPKIMTCQLKWTSLQKILIQKKKKIFFKTASFSLCSKVAPRSAKRFPVIGKIQEMWQNKCSQCLSRFGGGWQKRWQKYRGRGIAITNILNLEQVREMVDLDRRGRWGQVFGNTVSETVMTCSPGGLCLAKQSVKQEAWGRQPLPFRLSHCPRRK